MHLRSRTSSASITKILERQALAVGADLLIRVKTGRQWLVCARCANGSWLSRTPPGWFAHAGYFY